MAPERPYPNLKLNNILGPFEDSDFPMDGEEYGIKPGEHLSGHILNQYLNDYAKEFDLTSRIQLSSKVQNVKRKDDDTWVLTTNRSNGVSGSTTANLKE